MKKTKIGIVGATGYVGVELVRALSSHPDFEIGALVSQSYIGKRFSDIYPAFRKIVDLPCLELNPESLAAKCDAVITALPHGVSSALVPSLLDTGLRVLDHSGDFRYKNVSEYEKAYKLKHPCPELLEEAVYGLPELFRSDLPGARLVSNPGCYPTCSILAVGPLLKHGLVDSSSIIVDATSGISGAGRKADIEYQFCEADESFRAYSVVGHRHTSEIEQILSSISDIGVKITFTPHLAPIKRGMLATVYADLMPGVTEELVRESFDLEYGDEYFVRMLPKGDSPDTKNVAYSNFSDIAIFSDSRTGKVIILNAIDNLGKGASLQAIQSLNCMYGLKETTGLEVTGGGL